MNTPHTAFAIGTFARREGDAFPGLVVAGRVHDLREILDGVQRTGDLFRDWDGRLDELARRVASGELEQTASWDEDDLDVLPPVQPLGSLVAAGANYREHIIQLSVAHRLGRDDASREELAAEAAAETDERGAHGDPYVWVGLPSAISGARDDVVLPEVGAHADWELELGVVIGRDTYRVAVEDAWDSVAGYTICNDLTVRSLVPRTDIPMMGTDWFRSKNHPTFYPTGPYLVPARFVRDPAELRLRLSLNGEPMQDQVAGDMLFDIPQLISYVSSFAVLRPGDILITGSPSGNGSHYGRFLREGDVMESTITGLGAQRNEVRGPAGSAPPWYAGRGATGPS